MASDFNPWSRRKDMEIKISTITVHYNHTPPDADAT